MLPLWALKESKLLIQLSLATFAGVSVYEYYYSPRKVLDTVKHAMHFEDNRDHANASRKLKDAYSVVNSQSIIAPNFTNKTVFHVGFLLASSLEREGKRGEAEKQVNLIVRSVVALLYPFNTSH